MPSPKVIAVMLTWNQPDDTRKGVRSLVCSDYHNLSVIVVDNGSMPELYERTRDSLPGIEFLRSEINLGFPQGQNIGLRYALAHGADYALVINNDTAVDPHMVSQLVSAAEADPSAGVVGPVIYFMDQPDKVWFAGYRFKHGIYLLRRGFHLSPPIQPVEQVDFVSGCALLIRRSVLEQVGLLSKDYFLYYDDLDYCFRVKSAGMKILCVTDARMWHAVSASSNTADTAVKQYYQVKSSIIFCRKHLKGFEVWLNILLRVAHACTQPVKSLFHGRLEKNSFRLLFKGLVDGWISRLSKAEEQG